MASSKSSGSGSYGSSKGSSASSKGYGGYGGTAGSSASSKGYGSTSSKSSGSYGTSKGSSASSKGYGGTSSKSSGSYGTSKGSSAASKGYAGASTSKSGSYGTSKGSSYSGPSKSTSSQSKGSSGSYGTAKGSSAASKGYTSGARTSTGGTVGAGRGLSPGGPSLSKAAPSTPSKTTSPGYGWGGGSKAAGVAAERTTVGAPAPSLAGRTRMGGVTYGGAPAPSLADRTRMGSVTYGGGVTPPGSLAAGRIADRMSVPNYTRNLPTTGQDIGRYSGETWGTTGAGFNRAVAERYQGVPAYGGPGEGVGGGPGGPAGLGRERAVNPGRGESVGGPLTTSERAAAANPKGLGIDLPSYRALEVASMDKYTAGVKAREDTEAFAKTMKEAQRVQAQGMRDLDAYHQSVKDAFAKVETGHLKNPYQAKGPVHAKYGTPLGKYQVMSSNLPQWSQEVFGRVVSAQEFLNSPALQEQMFDAKMINGYLSDYAQDLQKAAEAWHAGPKNVGKVTSSKYKSTADYVSEVKANFEAAYPTQIAAAEFKDYKPGVSAPVTAATPAPAEKPAPTPTPAPARPAAAPAAAPAAPPAPASYAPAPKVPPSLAVQKPTETQPYKRSVPGQMAALGIDVLMGTNPVTLGANLAALLATGSTVGGLVWDASHGKYGENKYSPGDTAENREGATGRGREYPTATRTTPEAAAEAVEESTVPTTPAETFVAKYIDPPKPTEIPRATIPEPVYDWTPKQHSPLGRFSWEV